MTSINQARKLVEFYTHAAYLNKSKIFMWYEWMRVQFEHHHRRRHTVIHTPLMKKNNTHRHTIHIPTKTRLEDEVSNSIVRNCAPITRALRVHVYIFLAQKIIIASDTCIGPNTSQRFHHMLLTFFMVAYFGHRILKNFFFIFTGKLLTKSIACRGKWFTPE